MGFLYKSGRVRSYILVFLILAAFIISVPLKSGINNFVNNQISEFTDTFREKTGFTLTYESLSPSILHNFYIRGIQITDEDGVNIISIDKTKVTYKIFTLLKKDVQNGISSVVVDGIDLNVTQMINLYEKYKDLFSSQKIQISEIKKLIPQNIKLKNINFDYQTEKITASLSLKNVSIENSSKKNVLDFQLESFVKANITNIRDNLSCKLEINGSITESLNNSLMNIKFSDLTDGIYKLNKLNLLASYDNNSFAVHTIKAVNPIAIGVDYNVSSGDVNVQVKSDDFSPISLITMTSKQKELRKYKDLTVTTDTIIKSNLFEKTFNYITDANIHLPDVVFPEGAEVQLSLYGNESESQLTDFNVTGEQCNINAELGFVYDTFQLSGFVEIPKFVLPNGNAISTELYIDSLDKGFMAFSPQIFIGERALTAMQLTVLPQNDSYDFNFEVSDYSHLEEMEPGLIKIEGSYLNQSKYFQTNLSINSLYADSIAGIVSQVVDKENGNKIENFMEKLSQYMISSDSYISTDLKSISYNVPYVLLANTTKDNEVLMFAVNGNEQSIQLNQFSLVMGKYALEAAATLDRNPDTQDLFFTMDVNADSIPYHFSGTVMPEVCNITGDYGTDIEVRFDDNKKINGHFLVKSIPLKALDNTVVISTDADFSYNKDDGPSVQLNLFEAEGTDGNVTINPRVVFAGNFTKYGAQINSISYTDLYSALEGTADAMININDGILDSIGFITNLKNPLTEERISMDCNVSNPDHLPFSKENLMKYIYLNMQLEMNDVGLNRFAVQKNDNNYISASLNASGTIEHPYVSLNIDDLSFLFASQLLKGDGTLILEDKFLAVNDLDISYSVLNINDINGTASLDNMVVNATGNIDCNVAGRNIFAPLTLEVGNAIIPEGKLLPDYLTATISTPAVTGSLIKKEFPLSVSAIYSDKTISIFSSNNAGVNGSYNLDGLLQLSVDNGDFLALNCDGIANFKTANLDIYDINADFSKVCSYFNLDDLIKIEKGNVNGEVILTGSFNDPDLNGFVMISGVEGYAPIITPQKFTFNDIPIQIVNSEIGINDFTFTLKSGQKLISSINIFMNKWTIDHVEGSVKTNKKELFPIKMNTDILKLDADVSMDIQLYFESQILEVSGNIFGENVNISTNVTSLSVLNQPELEENLSADKNIYLSTDINLTLGTHSSFNFDPILRCVFVPNTKMKLKFDQSDNYYFIDGSLNLKSGDIAYLNRNFYIKSGSIKFNPDDIANPQITINAETREKDTKGQTVKIVMDIQKQNLLDFEPVFSSVPSKSETEIRVLLGQIAVADSKSATNFLFAASDYALQSMVVRQAENKLRDLCNFDIFSIRTNVLQNTLNLGVAGELSKENLSIGNFLDNTTVYIGKYLGSSLYFDAMLHLSVDNALGSITSTNGIIFQPEVGMELESPFANIRVNMAPDINAMLNNQFVPSTSLTLSWKISY